MNSVIFEKIEFRLSKQLLLNEESGQSCKVDINYTNAEGKSLLHFACEHGLEKLCITLVKLGANLNILDKYGTTPLMFACKMGYSRIVNELLLAGADPTVLNDYGVDLLPWTMLIGEVELFNKLINITENDNYYNSILGKITLTHIASALGMADYVEILTRKFPNSINIQVEKSGMTPLMLAVSGNFPLIVKILLDLGVDNEINSSYSMSAIHIAKSLNNLKIENYLAPLQHKSWNKTRGSDNLLPSIIITNSSLENCSLRTNQFISSSFTFQSEKIEPRHPLTPNIFISPKRKCKTDKTKNTSGLFQFKSLKRRSKSVEHKAPIRKFNESESKDILEYILISTKLYECWPLFKTHEINFKTFLTMSDDDLKSIGILKGSLRAKILKVIRHNKRVFC